MVAVLKYAANYLVFALACLISAIMIFAAFNFLEGVADSFFPHDFYYNFCRFGIIAEIHDGIMISAGYLTAIAVDMLASKLR